MLHIDFIPYFYKMDKFSVRKAVVGDAYGIAYVNAYTRYTTYKWLMPEKLLQTRIDSIDEKTEKVREGILEGKKYIVVENLDTNEIVWMSIFWNSRNEDYPNSGEIYAIYILKEYQKIWLGKKLFFGWINELINLWYDDMIISVLDWNPTIDFYKKYGGIVVWERYDQFGKALLKENILFFDDIKSIVK